MIGRSKKDNPWKTNQTGRDPASRGNPETRKAREDSGSHKLRIVGQGPSVTGGEIGWSQQYFLVGTFGNRV